MLQLKNIHKNYYVGSQTVEALKNINLTFRKNEFVSILGPSGCGKTTMLNLIGGLDQYTSGDLLIDGKSTKEFKDTNWDSYRNSTIGFVFQNYNLISHLTVLDNVEIALSLSGVSPKERKERATKVLNDVGLHDQLNKKPNQLSGGQMQRVAIARALVNDPDILLADEPTGALDTGTSKQIMLLIKEISKERLVIMVTHNSKIANEYSDRIIQLLDGEVQSDSSEVKEIIKSESKENLNTKKTSMSYSQAIKTSFKNLFTKKTRTFITAMAGSIGIIGVALVLGISTGMTNYVNEIQGDTLAGFPVTISSIIQTDQFGPPQGDGGPFQDNVDNEFPEDNIVYSYDPEASQILHRNVFDDTFITYLEDMDPSYYNSISYTSAVQITIVTQNDSGSYQLVAIDSDDIFSFFGGNVYSEMPDSEEFVLSQYDVLAGTYPETFNEVVLVVDRENKVEFEILEALGINIEEEYSFEDFIGREFKVIPNDVLYQNAGIAYLPRTNFDDLYNDEDSITITISGVLRVNQDATSDILSLGIGYTHLLTEYIHEDALNSEIVAAQIAEPDTNVLTGQPFNEQVTYEQVMQILGGDTTPTGIQIYPSSYEAKDQIKEYLDDFNVGKTEEESIVYTDIAELFSNAISELISTITIILTAFAGISLVVSSIMIGIITYVSVIERTKEIGIMRSLGARKKDISRIFNAETLLIGLTSGILGILVYFILQGPINIIINNLVEVEGFADLPIYFALGLILLSSALTLIAGIIPSRIAAKKDPVIALRTE